MTLRRVGGHVCFCPHALRQLLVCSTRRCANMPHVCSSRVGGHISWRRTMCGAATATRYRRRGSVPSGLWRWQCAEHPQRHRRGRRHSQHYRERRRLQDCTQPARVLLPAIHDHSHAITIAVFTHPGTRRGVLTAWTATALSRSRARKRYLPWALAPPVRAGQKTHLPGRRRVRGVHGPPEGTGLR